MTRVWPRVAHVPGAPLLTGILGVAGVLALVPNLVGPFHLYTATIGLTYLIAVVGLNLLLGFGGVISLGSSAFIMLGAYTVAVAQNTWDMSFWLSAPLAMVVCAVAGAITVAPVLRLGAFAVAVVTLAYLSVITSLIDIYPDVTGGGEGLAVQRSGATPTQLWIVFGVVAAVVYAAMITLMRSPYGRALNVGRLSPLLSQSLGSFPSFLKATAFTIAAATAGLSGALYPVLNGRVSTANFTVWISILLMLMVVVGGPGTLIGPFVGTLLLTIVPIVLDEVFEEGGIVEQLVYGIFLLLTVLVMPRGIAGAVNQIADRVRRMQAKDAAGVEVPDAGELDAMHIDESLFVSGGGASLDVAGLVKRIGGIRALDGAELHVRPGTIHGLIGPNGSGKTSLLNCVSGFYQVDSGTIELDGSTLPKHPARRAHAGIGRTFQQPLLLDQLSALENVRVGVDRHRKARWVEYLLRLPRARREAVEGREEASRWLQAVGLGADERLSASRLGPGKLRLVEVARALATRPSVLLMDEPAAGLSEVEMAHLESVIRAVRAAGITVVLVDHHADLVLRLCDEITVLANGAVIATGTPDEVRGNAVVINTYLGRRFFGDDPESEPANA